MRILLAMLLAVCLCGNYGCGDEGNAANSKEGAINKKTAALPKFKTPQELVRFVFKTLKNNDFKAFRHACTTHQDYVAIINKTVTDPAKRQSKLEDGKKRFDAHHENKLQIYFDLATKATDWTNVKIKEVKTSKIKSGEVNIADWIVISFDNGWKLNIYEATHAPRGWVIGDDVPLHMKNASGKTLYPSKPAKSEK